MWAWIRRRGGCLATSAAAAKSENSPINCIITQMKIHTRKNSGKRWTQLPLTFCCGQKPEQNPFSPAPPNDEHTGPLADFVCEIAIKTTADQLWSWRLKHSKRIKNNLSTEEAEKLEEIYNQKMEALDDKVQTVRTAV